MCDLALILIIIAFDLPSSCDFIYKYIRWILSLSACIELCIKAGVSSWLAGIETFVQKSDQEAGFFTAVTPKTSTTQR